MTITNIPEIWEGGLEEVNFVLREMLPDGNGTVLDFSTESIVTETYQLTLNSSYVKNNCELVFFVQNMVSGEIMETKKVDLDTFVGIEDENELKFSVYPNPTSVSVSIAASEIIDEISVISLTGQTLIQLNPEEKLVQISTENFAKGIYSLKVKTESGISVEQLVVE